MRVSVVGRTHVSVLCADAIHDDATDHGDTSIRPKTEEAMQTHHRLIVLAIVVVAVLAAFGAPVLGYAGPLIVILLACALMMFVMMRMMRGQRDDPSQRDNASSDQAHADQAHSDQAHSDQGYSDRRP